MVSNQVVFGALGLILLAAQSEAHYCICDLKTFDNSGTCDVNSMGVQSDAAMAESGRCVASTDGSKSSLKYSADCQSLTLYMYSTTCDGLLSFTLENNKCVSTLNKSVMAADCQTVDLAGLIWGMFGILCCCCCSCCGISGLVYYFFCRPNRSRGYQQTAGDGLELHQLQGSVPQGVPVQGLPPQTAPHLGGAPIHTPAMYPPAGTSPPPGFGAPPPPAPIPPPVSGGEFAKQQVQI